MTKITVECMSCGDRTVFTDEVADNDHIEVTAPNKYKCNGCGNYSDCGEQETFRVS